MSNAEKLAEQFENYGFCETPALKSSDYYKGKLKIDIDVINYKYTLEKMELNETNKHYQKDCAFRDYDWNAMYEEDKYMDDSDYIYNLKTNLTTTCECSDHI